MGILKNGPFGGFTGKVNNLVSYELNGQQILKSVAGPSKKPATIAQLNNQKQMKVINAFVKGAEAFIKTGFHPGAVGTKKNFHNLAVQYNKPQAMTGYYPDITIDYSKIILSKGSLTQATNVNATWVEEGLKFTWEHAVKPVWPETEDQVMLLAYTTEKDLHFYVTSGAKRTKGWDILEIPASLHQERFELYVSFVSNDRLDVADSQYIGAIEA
ncbi:DUF6266 family protein [Pedobacter immunditicola]|uniref:DUF6266 family protein n=1 Tax=Pedobacter immunditicola TaxID=3133440 RepID=UPI0030ADBA2D